VHLSIAHGNRRPAAARCGSVKRLRAVGAERPVMAATSLLLESLLGGKRRVGQQLLQGVRLCAGVWLCELAARM
jgi:hypothetical protein